MLVNNKLLKISNVMCIGRTHQLISSSLLRCYSSLFRPTPFYCKLSLQENEQVHSTRILVPVVNQSHHLQLCTNSSRKLPVLTLYTKQHCPLCDEALHHLEPFLGQVVLEKVDITTTENKAWWKLYRYEIPVFHLDGRYLMKHKADLDIFKAALSDFHKKNVTSDSGVD
ncbi:hypothetical protein BsWGS_00695 [Bradybaena similaris]